MRLSSARSENPTIFSSEASRSESSISCPRNELRLLSSSAQQSLLSLNPVSQKTFAMWRAPPKKSVLQSRMCSSIDALIQTGLQGLSGNKGGVGVRLDIADSSVCFMTCHLAAGHGNISERHADYRTISGGLSFLRGKTIDDHESVCSSTYE